MRIVRFAAGLAVGYVLGSRAGREKYEQIVELVRKGVGDQSTAPTGEPSAVLAGDTTPELVGFDADTTTSGADETAPVDAVRPKPRRRKAAPSTAADDTVV